MALRPPEDFAPPSPPAREPSEAELRALWERVERARGERERERAWRRALEEVRRAEGGELRPAAGVAALAGDLADGEALGPVARAALRPAPREGRVAAAGVDTWSPCWYARPGGPLARVLGRLAIEPAARAMLLPDSLAGHRVGWFPEPGLVFAEGRPGGETLLGPAALAAAYGRLADELGDFGVPVAAAESAGLRRLDVAVDVCPDSSAEGLALLECVALASFGAGRLAAYRGERSVRSVLLKSRAGRTLARVYDKGAERAELGRGRWLRLEAQWRFARGERPAPDNLAADFLRERFKRRFQPLWQAAGGFRTGGLAVLGERLADAVGSGQLRPSRARSIAGYLVLVAAGVPQGAARTVAELERECRQLGLSLSLLETGERRVDLATVLDECLVPALWSDR